MFERVHHQRIARLLAGLNAELLVRQRCLMLADASASLPLAGVAKAEHAYGPAIRDCFAKAQAHLLERPGRLQKCMQGLAIKLPESRLRGRIAKLRLAECA